MGVDGRPRDSAHTMPIKEGTIGAPSLRALTQTGLVLAIALGAGTPPARADGVDDYVRDQMRRQHIPGLSLAILQEGRVVKAAGYGMEDLEHAARAKPGTVYQLASLTKQFVAAAIMLLVQDGKLDTGDPLSRYIENTPASWKSITIRHLLTHTSGIKDFLNEAPDRREIDSSPEQIVSTLEKLPLNFPPGDRWSYSNSGYLLLALIVRKVSGERFDHFLDERVFRPLGMTSTRLNSDPEIIPRRARGYMWSGSGWVNAPYLNPTRWDNGESGLLSTAPDLAKWMRALTSGTILSAGSLAQMWQPVTLNDGSIRAYGFGWALLNTRGSHVITHAGGRADTSTVITSYLDDRLTVIVLANEHYANVDWIARHIASQYILGLLPAPRTVRARRNELEAITGRYEYADNQMATVTTDGKRLYLVLGSELLDEVVPSGQNRFISNDRDHQGFDILRDRAHRISGLLIRRAGEERKALRIGPLIHQLRPQKDPDPTLTDRVGTILESLAPGSAAAGGTPRLSAGAQKDFAGGEPRLEGVRWIRYLASEDISGRGLERHGAAVARVVYYRLSNGLAALVYLTSDGLLTDEDVVDD